MSSNKILRSSYYFLGLFILSTNSETSTSRTIEEENAQLFNPESVQGQIAELPCNITPAKQDDKISTVIWYKNGHTSSPIYTYDARETILGKHWSDKEIIRDRGSFNITQGLAIMSIRPSKSTDTGLYRCRVDFNKSPTRNSNVNLTIIIPPENILIQNERGMHIDNYRLGPYNEGASINVTCISSGGRPLPRLTWWTQENKIVDDSYTSFDKKKVRNILHIEKLQRHHLNAMYRCEASNNNVSEPIHSTVSLDMNLRPLWVKLQGENKPLSAGHPYDLQCVVVGSRPVPTITWWLGSVPMTNTTEMTNPEGNKTISILTFTPTIEDGGKFLSCRGVQSLIPDSGLESGWKLDIHHVPVVSLELGSNLNSSIIRDGADVYFECNIKSNPWVYKVNWRHNGKELYNNGVPGITIANQSLVLQNVTRIRSGIYTCIGSNKEGDGESNPVHLDIKFAPICRPGQIQNYGVAREETAKIICELEANPHDVNFTWRFNSTNGLDIIELPVSAVTVDRAKSIAHFTAKKEDDYGTLLCWGSNEIGVQLDPCVYSINPAGRPDPPTNCTVLNQTNDTLQLECVEGFDGGLPQEFLIQVYSLRTKQLIASQTSKVATFELKGLQPEIGYKLVLSAVNEKGSSNSTVHHIDTLNNAEKHTDFLLPYPGSVLHMKLFLGAIAGLILGIILIIVATLLIFRVRKSNKTSNNKKDDNNGCRGDEYGGILANGQSVQITNDGGAIRDSCSGSTESFEEKNPDIIPQGNEEEKAMKWLNTMQPNSYTTLTLSGANPNLSAYNDKCQYITDKTNVYQLHEHTDFLKQQRNGILLTTDSSQHQINNNPSSYAELSLVMSKQNQQQTPPSQRQQQQQIQNTVYTSATLGRPRYKDVRLNEPTIYAQIDLAHNPVNNKLVNYTDTQMTWIPASQAQLLRQFHQPDHRTMPIVCSREATNLTKLPLDHRNPATPVTSTTINSNTSGQISRF